MHPHGDYYFTTFADNFDPRINPGAGNTEHNPIRIEAEYERQTAPLVLEDSESEGDNPSGRAVVDLTATSNIGDAVIIL